MYKWTLKHRDANGSNKLNPLEFIQGSNISSGANLFDKTTITAGYYVNGTTGALTATAGFNASDFIKIDPSTAYYVGNTGSGYYAIYDGTKTYITGQSVVPGEYGFTTPANAAYVRITVRDANLDTGQIELGTAFTQYEPFLSADKAFTDSTSAYGGITAVSPSQVYQTHVSVGTTFKKIIYYDFNKRYASAVLSPTSVFTIPSGVYYARIVIASEANGEDVNTVGMALGSGSAFVDYFTNRQVYPIYKTLSRDFEKQASYQFYREKLDGNLKLTKHDYDYIEALDFDQKMYLEIEDLEGILPNYLGQFYKTDCKWNSDDRIVEIKTEPADDYVEILGGLDKTFNIIQEAPELQDVILRRRPVIQVYIPGDTVLTNFLGGSYWEQEIQVDPVFDHNTLVNTYKFYNSKNIRVIPASYSQFLSTDVTGEYDDAGLQDDGNYELKVQTDSFYPGYARYRYFIVPVGSSPDIDGSYNSTGLYRTPFSNWKDTSINALLFSGINGETGEFYFTDYKIYVRYYTDLLDVRGTATYPVPSEDIVANNSNYKRVIGYNIDDFYIYDEFVDYPTKFGKVPEGAPDAGRYYKEFQVSVVTGLSNPSPVSSSNWKSVSLWFFTTLDIRYTEFIDGEDFTLRDSYPLHSVIQVLLREIGSHVTFDNTTEHSEFLYSTTNPLGGFTFLDFDGGTLLSDYVGNLHHFVTPKSNIMVGDYDQPAQKSEVTLSQILNMLRDVYKCYWHIENRKLRIEHVSWYQKGGTYNFTPIVGADLTQLVQPRNGKNWGFSQNKWEFDKENMPERFEFGWMDDVSIPFEGKPIQMRSSFVQLGRVEDMNVNGVTTDIDFIMANPQNISRDGLCLLGAVEIDGVYRMPYIEANIGYNSEVIMQNGFLSWLYLHPKFHTYDLPSDKVTINGEDEILYDNITQKKKQEVVYPATQVINPFQLVKTDLGNGIVDKLSVNMESLMIKATIKHDTE